ncbi:MAG: hypothetical protein IJS61_06350 [Firmicutes bacterium]|nr:hypothetical protein [Bacillota bacterium]
MKDDNIRAKAPTEKILYFFLILVFAILTFTGIAFSYKAVEKAEEESKVQVENKEKKRKEVSSHSSSSESTSESTTSSEKSGVKGKEKPVDCYYNKDGKLKGKKGEFSGLWPELEAKAKASKEQYIKDLMVYVGDNTELSKVPYQEDNFVAINGYGMVHWAQWGHSWPNRYSVSMGSGNYSSSSGKKKETTDTGKNTEGTRDKAEEEYSELFDNDPSLFSESEESRKLNIPNTILGEEENIEVENSVAEESKYTEGREEELIVETLPEEGAEAPQAISETNSDTSSEEKAEAEATLEDTQESSEVTKAEKPVAGKKKDSVISTSAVYYPGSSTSFSRGGSTWGSSACGVCSLAMALSTLSGVTVSPPEVALAANLLVGRSGWYGAILFSSTQAQLARMAGFPVKTEPWNSATKAQLDDCLDHNGIAIFVTDKQVWASGGGRHYIVVRNRVGDKYYTADSGKNPINGFTYTEISSGYNQQMIVYIYPKSYKEK